MSMSRFICIIVALGLIGCMKVPEQVPEDSYDYSLGLNIKYTRRRGCMVSVLGEVNIEPKDSTFILTSYGMRGLKDTAPLEEQFEVKPNWIEIIRDFNAHSDSDDHRDCQPGSFSIILVSYTPLGSDKSFHVYHCECAVSELIGNLKADFK